MSETSPQEHPTIRWVGKVAAADLDGFEVIEWSGLLAGPVASARGTPSRRDSLARPAERWLAWLAGVRGLALRGVVLTGPEDLAALLGFVVDPARRQGVELLIECPRPLAALRDADFLEPPFGYAYSLQRLRWALRPDPATPRSAAIAPRAEDSFPDPGWQEAVAAPDGVVQVIAPAGSGKTAVLASRAASLRAAGVPAAAIACLVFNRAARLELGRRLTGIGVEALTFHALALRILKASGGLADRPTIAAPSPAEWRRLCALARDRARDGVWIDPREAPERLSTAKLGSLLAAEEYAAAMSCHRDPRARTMAALYTAHAELQRDRGRIDFDDLLLRAVNLLRGDGAAREHWQARYGHLLIDEYQDVEPAQELIVRILAAPQDRIFCVGDEDQVLYGFRRAEVGRMIGLDLLYPALHRVALDTNLRSPDKIVDASRRLISVNRARFPKQIRASGKPGTVRLYPDRPGRAGSAALAGLIAAATRGDLVVLARTNAALRPLILLCAERGIPVDADRVLFRPQGPRLAIARHLRLALHPTEADPELLAAVCMLPRRPLQRGAARVVSERLRQGGGFAAALAGAFRPSPRSAPTSALAEILERLARCEDAAEAVALLRGPGGLDRWLADLDSTAAAEGHEADLADAASEAAGLTPAAYLARLEDQAALLASARREGAVELATIHAAKGRQWPHVVLIACEEGILPHRRSFHTAASREAQGSGIEAERRLAYVALTRAERRLDIHFDPLRPSRFLFEAGLLRHISPSRPPVPKRAASTRDPPPEATRESRLATLLGLLGRRRAADR